MQLSHQARVRDKVMPRVKVIRSSLISLLANGSVGTSCTPYFKTRHSCGTSAERKGQLSSFLHRCVCWFLLFFFSLHFLLLKMRGARIIAALFGTVHAVTVSQDLVSAVARRYVTYVFYTEHDTNSSGVA